MWRVELRGNRHDIAAMAGGLLDDDRFSVIEDGQYFYLIGGALDAAGTPDEARSLARDLLELLNLATAVGTRGYLPVDVGDGVDDGKGSRHVFNTQVTVQVRAMWRTTSAGPRRRSLTELVIDLDPFEPTVRSVALRCRTSDLSPVAMYAIYEIIRESVGKPDDLGWVSTNELTRFTRSMNHPAVHGPHSRHGHVTAIPPSNPMDLDEARSLVDMLIIEWTLLLARRHQIPLEADR